MSNENKNDVALHPSIVEQCSEYGFSKKVHAAYYRYLEFKSYAPYDDNEAKKQATSILLLQKERQEFLLLLNFHDFIDHDFYQDLFFNKKYLNKETKEMMQFWEAKKNRDFSREGDSNEEHRRIMNTCLYIFHIIEKDYPNTTYEDVYMLFKEYFNLPETYLSKTFRKIEAIHLCERFFKLISYRNIFD